MHDHITIEKAIQSNFGINLEISQSILKQVPVSRMANATLFLTGRKQLYLYVSSNTKTSLGNIHKIVSRMGLKVERYFPPKNQPDYFEESARRKFCEVFPGRKVISNNDLRFYRTLVPYGPALVLISEVKNGEVYQYDSDSYGGWRVGARFAYRRIKTS